MSDELIPCRVEEMAYEEKFFLSLASERELWQLNYYNEQDTAPDGSLRKDVSVRSCTGETRKLKLGEKVYPLEQEPKEAK